MTKAKTIWVLHSVNAHWGAEVLRGLARFSEHREPWEFRVVSWGEAPPGIPSSNDPVDGLVVAIRDEQHERELRDCKLPCVNVSGTRAVKWTPSVLVDDAAIGKTAAEYLMHQGLRQFAYIGNEKWHFSHPRGRGFAEAVESAGYSCGLREPPRQLEAGVTEQELDELSKWLSTLPYPVGVLACNDIRARDTARAAARAELRVPDDVAIVGVDNDELLCSVTVPPLSSIDTGAQRVGYEAGRLLERLMRGQNPPSEPIRIRPQEVVARRSSDVVAVSDHVVAEALRYIKRHVSNGLTVGAVVAEMGVSRRLLERRFRKVLDRTVHDEIRRAQIDTARRLLVETDMPLAEVTRRCGFRYFSHFSQVCKEELSMPPGEYRQHFRLT
ncbi:MAG: substrate-binding domain-containing protein [Phycisphaerae bacterium]